eukprot:TRINITY_DN4229_c0_g1_i1.p2 TRINITY_DN4229_c0_g1~~TRINITY_DN4229_c0_g1_i1.p2  ORF type:complete len:105 (+),score=49.44 TRINITY_DN4229_c0_g1_i1:12-326(+)
MGNNLLVQQFTELETGKLHLRMLYNMVDCAFDKCVDPSGGAASLTDEEFRRIQQQILTERGHDALMNYRINARQMQHVQQLAKADAVAAAAALQTPPPPPPATA